MSFMWVGFLLLLVEQNFMMRLTSQNLFIVSHHQTQLGPSPVFLISAPPPLPYFIWALTKLSFIAVYLPPPVSYDYL